MLIGIKMKKKKKKKKKKKTISELGHGDRLNIYVNPSKIHVNPGI